MISLNQTCPISCAGPVSQCLGLLLQEQNSNPPSNSIAAGLPLIMSSLKNETIAMSLPSWLPMQGLQSSPEPQQFLLASLVAAFVILSAYHLSSRKPFPAPYVGYRSWLEPTFLVRLRSVLSLREMINEGYSKVSSLRVSSHHECRPLTMLHFNTTVQARLLHCESH